MSSSTQFSPRMKITSSYGNNVMISSSPESTESIVVAAQKEHDQEEYQRGWNDCQNSMQKQLDAMQEQLSATSKEIPVAIQGYLDELERQMEEEVCNLAFHIANVILGEEMKNIERVNSVIRQAVKPILNFQGVKLHLSPSVVSHMETGEGISVPTGVTVIPDSKLMPAEVVLDSNQGIIDATLQGRLDTLKDDFIKIINEQGKTDV